MNASLNQKHYTTVPPPPPSFPSLPSFFEQLFCFSLMGLGNLVNKYTCLSCFGHSEAQTQEANDESKLYRT